MTAKGNKNVPTFEESLEKLETIVGKLEGGSLGLEESLKAFEEGMSVYRQCMELLEKSRNRVESLLKKGEEIVTTQMPVDREADEE